MFASHLEDTSTLNDIDKNYISHVYVLDTKPFTLKKYRHCKQAESQQYPRTEYLDKKSTQQNTKEGLVIVPYICSMVLRHSLPAVLENCQSHYDSKTRETFDDLNKSYKLISLLLILSIISEKLFYERLYL